MATLKETNRYVEIEDKEIVLVQKDRVEIQKLDGTVVEREAYVAEIDAADTEKGTYPHFMLKEIDEQPIVIRKIIQEYQGEDDTLRLDDNIREAMKKSGSYLYYCCRNELSCRSSWKAVY